VGFFATIRKLTPHVKGKKMQKKHSTSYRMRPTMQQKRKESLAMQQERKEKEEKGGEGRKKKVETHSAEPTHGRP
jgi:hypothetical protein